ncbi:hypothetical protein SAMN05216483_0838 [Streptomyces sp. 2131.1]|nr:hypothetical protein SAMN05216483_0838 [Streptomyces sp. 2131.1]
MVCGTGKRSLGRWTPALGGPRTPGSATRGRCAAETGAVRPDQGTGSGGGTATGHGTDPPGPGGGNWCAVRGCSAAAHGVRYGPRSAVARGSGTVSSAAERGAAGAAERGVSDAAAAVDRGASDAAGATCRVAVAMPTGRPGAVVASVVGSIAVARAGSPAPDAAGAPPARVRTARSSATRYRRAAGPGSGHDRAHRDARDTHAPRPRSSGRLPGAAFPGGCPGRGVTRIGRGGRAPRCGGARS